MDKSNSAQLQEPNEQAVRQALAAYKIAMVQAHYRNWWHRAMCWSGHKSAVEAEAALRNAERMAITIANLSLEHQAIVRRISLQQPEQVRKEDAFMALIQ